MIKMDLESLSVQEIQELINKNKQEAIDCAKICSDIDQEISKAKGIVKQITSKIPEIKQIASRRTESLERRRMAERKLLSLYTRFPGFISKDKKHILSTDIYVLKKQLENAKKRKNDLGAAILDLTNQIEDLKKKKIELVSETNEEQDRFAQRIDVKRELEKTLRNELNLAKSQFVPENRMIEQSLTSSKVLLTDLNLTYEKLQNAYQNGIDGRKLSYGNLPEINRDLSVQIEQLQKETITKTENLIAWWSSRRYQNFLENRKNLLISQKENSMKIMNDSFESIERLKRNNEAKSKVISDYNKMNQQLEEKLNSSKQREEKLRQKLKEEEANFVPLPQETLDQLEQRRNEYQNLVNEKKYLDIDIQLYSYKPEDVTKYDKRVEAAMRKNFEALLRMVRQKEKNEALKKQIKQRENNELLDARISAFADQSLISDPRILMTDDGTSCVVQAGPLELLIRLALDANNRDPLYIKSLVIMLHTIKADAQVVLREMTAAFGSGSPVKTRLLNKFLTVWSKWFPADFKQIEPLASLTGFTAPVAIDKDGFVITKLAELGNDDEIPFTSEPFIIAAHFTYVELQLMKAIKVSEFIATCWTKPQKWIESPNLMKLTDHFNTVTSYIVEKIVTAGSKDKRLKIIERWTMVMDAAHSMNNFLLVFSIYAAICNPAVSLFKRTFKSVSPEMQKVLERMQTTTSPLKKFATYLSELEAVPQKLVIPYLGPFLTDLIYVHDGNASTKKLPGSGEEVLNFSKYRAYTGILTRILKKWGVEYNFKISKKLLRRIKMIQKSEIADSDLFKMAAAALPKQDR